MLKLPPDLGINPTFNVSDLVEYREPVSIPSEPFESDSLMSKPIPECPPINRPERKDRIEKILDDQAISTHNQGYQRYLVQWQGQPESEDSWISREDLQQLDPDILEKYQNRIDPYSTGSSSSHTGRIGAAPDRDRGYRVSLWISDL